MHIRIRLVAAALILLGAGAQGGMAAEPRVWYVYCEGASPEGHRVVFSENFWSHPETADYGRRVGSAAKAFFESRHDLPLDGCSGVNFSDGSLAEHSRTLTIQLHRRMGDRIYFFPLPAEVLPVDAPSASVVAASARASDGGASTDQTADPREREERRLVPSTAPR